VELTKYFEYNIFPQVIEYVKQHPTIDAKTALLIFLTDTVRNAVNYNAISNNVKREKEVELLYPRFTEQILDLGFQYRSYLDEYKQLEEALCRLPDLSNDYIRGNYSRENVSRVLEMLIYVNQIYFLHSTPLIISTYQKYRKLMTLLHNCDNTTRICRHGIYLM